MKQKPRIYYSDSQKALMWERWRKGDSLQQIAQLFDRNHSSVQRILAETGGISPMAQCRSKRALTLAEREEISRGLVAGYSIRALATQLKRAPSTVSREVKRNGGREGYRANQADQATWARAHRPKPCKLAENPGLAHIVANKLHSLWSPEQIAGWLKRIYPDNASYQVSHETIYRTLYIQTRGALKKELLACIYGGREACAALAITRKRPTITAESSMRYQLANGPLRLMIEPYRGTGKGTCCAAATIARLPRWSNVNRAT